MTHKNVCSACEYNFASPGTFDGHRVGEFTTGKVGTSNRRCLTSEEMLAKGWVCKEESVTFYSEGQPYQKLLPTWSIPMSDERIQKLRSMKKGR